MTVSHYDVNMNMNMNILIMICNIEHSVHFISSIIYPIIFADTREISIWSQNTCPFLSRGSISSTHQEMSSNHQNLA